MAPRGAWLLLLALPALVLPAPAPSPAPHDGEGGEGAGPGWAAGVLPALALLAALAALLLGCSWCHRYQNCKLFGARRASTRSADAARAQPEVGGGARDPPAEPEPERGPVYLVRGPPPPDNNNLFEDNNNGPISLREMQNIENNNAAVYIISENENRNALHAREEPAAVRLNASRESVVQFEPLPVDITPSHQPHQLYPEWFAPQQEDFPRNQLQYLREIGRGSFGRIVEGEMDGGDGRMRRAVAVKILEQQASGAERARFLRDAALFRDARHHNVLALLARNLHEDPWLLIFDLCSMDLQQYLISNRPQMCALHERGLPLRLKCDIAAGLAYLHALGYVYGSVWSGGVLVSGGGGEEARALLGHYGDARSPHLAPWTAPEMMAHPALAESSSSEVWSLGVVLWEVCSWGEPPPPTPAFTPPPLPCPYRDHLYQVMQLCWSVQAERRPSAAQVHALLEHLHTSHLAGGYLPADPQRRSADFEERWQRLKPNSIPKVDEHVAIVHADAHLLSSRFTRSEDDFTDDTANHVQPEREMVASRSSSIVSDTLPAHHKSDSLTNLHGSLEDVRNVHYLAADATILESQLEASTERTLGAEPQQRSCEHLAEKVDPWLAEVMAHGDDVGYYRDVSDVIKNLDSILNSEKTSSSESSHQASPSREHLALHVCVSEPPPPPPSALVKSPGITDFRHILELPPRDDPPPPPPHREREHDDRDAGGALRHSFERNSEMNTPSEEHPASDASYSLADYQHNESKQNQLQEVIYNSRDGLVKKSVPSLKDLCTARANYSISSYKDQVESETKDCRESCDNRKLFKKLEVRAGVEREGLTNSEPSGIERAVQNVSVDSDDAREKDILPKSAVAVESQVKLDKSDEVIDNKLEQRPHQDYSDEAEVESEKNSISDTEVLSMDNDSTVYMDLKTTPTDSRNREETENSLNKGLEKDITKLCSNLKESKDECINKYESRDLRNDSTQYLDLPQVLRDTTAFLHAEKSIALPEATPLGANRSELSLKSPPYDLDKNNMLTSTPKITIVEDDFKKDISTGVDSGTVENSKEARNEEEMFPNYGPGVTVTRLEQQSVRHMFSESPFGPPESIEQSSVMLGPFESCTLDYFTGIKTEPSEQSNFDSDLPREELLAFSSNFVELNLDSENVSFKTDLLSEESEPIGPPADPKEKSPHELHPHEATKLSFSPTTPPNSPGIYLSSSPQHKYLVHDQSDDVSPVASRSSAAFEPALPVEDDLDLNHIEIQFTTKLAMAENENNLNIEYSGPLSIEELAPPESLGQLELDEAGVETPPECNECPREGGARSSTESLEDSYREGYALDEECVRALRTELELKLPLAQASVCEPAEECPVHLPAPPVGAEAEAAATRDELVLCYPGALSPILEETDPQLCAYHNNLNWTTSQRTDSSESYPEPCNNSTDEITDLVTAVRSHEPADAVQQSDESAGSKTFTIHKDDLSNEMSMSADSLDDGTLRDVVMPSTSANIPTQPVQSESSKVGNEIKSPVDVDCERISQISPFLLSPTADSCKINTDSNENPSNISKLSKPTLPSDMKSSKASDTQCHSKATSIDSWCSNDTLFNVEDNFDEFIMDSDVEAEREDPSRSSDTLTQEDEAGSKNGSTYLIHDSKSDKCDSFTPDSITANNYTYTKVRESPTKQAPAEYNVEDSPEEKPEITDKSKDAFVSSANELTSFDLKDKDMVNQVEDLLKIAITNDIISKDQVENNDCLVSRDQLGNQDDSINKNQNEKKIESASKDRIENQNEAENQDGFNQYQNKDDSVSKDTIENKEGLVKKVQVENHDGFNKDQSENKNILTIQNKIEEKVFLVDIDKLENQDDLVNNDEFEKISNLLNEDSLLNKDDFVNDDNFVANDDSGNNGLPLEPIEQMRRSPLDRGLLFNMTPPAFIDTSVRAEDSLLTKNRPHPVMSKMDSVDIACLKEDLLEALDTKREENVNKPTGDQCDITSLNNGVASAFSPERHYRGMANSVTSTPLLIEAKSDEPMQPSSLSTTFIFKTPQIIHETIPDFEAFVNSAELRPQDMSPYVVGNATSLSSGNIEPNNPLPLLNGSKEIHNSESLHFNSGPIAQSSTELENKTSGYSEFHSSAKNKPQELSSFALDSKFVIPSIFDGIGSSVDFLQFEREVEQPHSLMFLVSSVTEKTNGLEPVLIDSSSEEIFSLQKTVNNPVSSDDAVSNKEEFKPDDLSQHPKVNLKNFEVQLKSVAEEKHSSTCTSPQSERVSSAGMSENVWPLPADSSEEPSSHVISNHIQSIAAGGAFKSSSTPVVVMEDHSGDVHTYVPIQTMKSGIEFKNDNCPSFSTFECSAQNKPQELSSFTNQNYTDIPNSSKMDVTNRSSQFSSFERSAATKPQDLSSVLKASESSQSSQNYNETFETFDSHKTQSRPEVINEGEDQSRHKDSSQDSMWYKDKKQENVEQNQSVHRNEHVEDTNRSDENNDDQECNFESLKRYISSAHLINNKQQSDNVHTNNVEIRINPPICEEEFYAFNVDPIVKLPSTSNKVQHQEDLGFYEHTESKNDSLVSVSEENHLHSDTTNLDKEISITSTVEESEPTTREMDSLDNHLEIVNEEVIVHNEMSQERSPEITAKSSLQNCGKYIIKTVDDDQDIIRAIEELDQVIEANGINVDTDIISASPSSSLDGSEGKQGDERHTLPEVAEICSVTNNFIQHEKNCSEVNSYLPLLSDIRFTGPSSDYMSTSFNQESPCEDASMLMLESELKKAEENAEKLGSASADALKEWESESEDSQTNSTSSGEFIWKDGEGQERFLTTTTDFDDNGGGEELGSIAEGSEGSGSDGDGSDGDEVEFVPSSWDCRAAPAKSSLKSLEQSPTNESKKRVVFKRQKYHCVYEYPREILDDYDSLPAHEPRPLHSPYLPDYSTYAVWEALSAGSAGDVELGYAHPGAAPLHLYSAFSPSYGLPDEDFFISSSARPFESLGIMSTTSQFFPGLHATLKAVSSLERSDSPTDDYPPLPSPLGPAPAALTAVHTHLPHLGSLDFTTPDSGVEDVTPGCALDEEPPDAAPPSPAAAERSRLKLRAPEGSTSSSESPSPSSPCWEALGGLRHTRDRLKLDLPPSPLPNLGGSASRHGQRVFNFLPTDASPASGTRDPASSPAPSLTPLVMSDETPVVRAVPLPLDDDDDVVVPEPTFSTFGKTSVVVPAPDTKPIVLSDEARASDPESAEAEGVSAGVEATVLRNKALLDAVKGEGTVLDSGDEDSGIESSAKTTLERNPPSHTAT